ncbi:unnamed protein product [Pylaiella littoralis]
MEPAASEGDTERHAELVALLVAAMRRRRERRVARTVAVWQVVLRDYSDDDDAETNEDNDPPMKRTRRVLPRPDYRASFWLRMLGETGLKEPGSREARLFRRRFRIPYQFFTASN